MYLGPAQRSQRSDYGILLYSSSFFCAMSISLRLRPSTSFLSFISVELSVEVKPGARLV